jgi:DNA-directed RNA polymerase specialized sigma24 family protein
MPEAELNYAGMGSMRGPEHGMTRAMFYDRLEKALAELPQAQRYAFERHEIDGASFQEIAAETGVAVNTLIARKRYAVLHLRDRLQVMYDEIVVDKTNDMNVKQRNDET